MHEAVGQSIIGLLGEDLGELGLGQNMAGELLSGYIPDRSIVYMPQAQLGDGLAGPPNDQALQIFEDTRPLAVEELGMQGPLVWEKFARHRAGRMFPLNLEWNAGLDDHNPGRPPRQQMVHPTPFNWQQDPRAHAGHQAPEVLPAAKTVFFTASPHVGFTDY